MKYTTAQRVEAARLRMEKRKARQIADRIARHCTTCGKWFMSAAQKMHHDANAARLCAPASREVI